MNPKRVLFYGNCQAASLATLLRLYGADIGFETLVSDVSAPTTPEAIAPFQTADVIVEQVFSRSKKLDVEELNPRATVIRFPVTSAQFLWPYATTDRNMALPVALRTHPFAAELSDGLLNKMTVSGVHPAEAAQRYAEHDIIKKARVGSLFEMHLDLQRERDAKTDIPMAEALVDSLSGAAKSFYTRGHPWGDLYWRLAGYVLEAVGLPAERIETARAELYEPPEFPPNELPIHPAIIEHFGIRWQDPAAKYEIYEDHLDWATWVQRYVEGECNLEILAARGFIDQKDFSSAIAMLGRHRARTDRLAHVAFRMEASALWRLDRRSEACDAAWAAFDAACSNPGMPTRAWGLIGQLLLECGRKDVGEQAIRRALAHQPNNFRWRHLLLAELRRQDRVPEAIVELDACTRLRPWSRETALARFELRLASNQLDGLVSEPNLTTNELTRLAQRLVESDRVEEAIAALLRAAAAEPLNANLRAALGHYYGRIGKMIEAEGAFRCAIAIAPETGRLHRSLGHTLAHQKRFEGCLAAAVTAVELDETDAESRAFLSAAHRHLGQIAQAERQLAVAVSLKGGEIYSKQLDQLRAQCGLTVAPALDVASPVN